MILRGRRGGEPKRKAWGVSRGLEDIFSTRSGLGVMVTSASTYNRPSRVASKSCTSIKPWS